MSISSGLAKKLSGQYDEEVIQRLSLECRGLNEIKNLYNCKNLVQLSLAQNDLTVICGLEALSELKRLDLSYNKIRTLEGIESNSLCETLVYLDLRGNLISAIGEVNALIAFQQLRTLHFQGPDGEDANPLCSHPSYPAVVLQSLPLLQILDSSHVSLLAAVSQIEAQMAAVVPQEEALRDLPLESWIDAGEMELLDSADPLSNQVGSTGMAGWHSGAVRVRVRPAVRGCSALFTLLHLPAAL